MHTNIAVALGLALALTVAAQVAPGRPSDTGRQIGRGTEQKTDTADRGLKKGHRKTVAVPEPATLALLGLGLGGLMIGAGRWRGRS